MAENGKLTLGEILISENLLNREPLAEVLVFQKQQAKYKPLGEICVDKGWLAKEDLKRVLAKYKKRIKLGDLFVNLGIITPRQLGDALSRQKDNGKRLGDVRLDMGIINDDELARALSMQLDIPLVKPDVAVIDKNLFAGLRESFLRQSLSLPLAKYQDVLTAVMVDPLRDDLAKDYSLLFGCRVEVAVASRTDIRNAIDEVYSPVEIVEALREFGKERSLDRFPITSRRSSIDISDSG